MGLLNLEWELRCRSDSSCDSQTFNLVTDGNPGLDGSDGAAAGAAAGRLELQILLVPYS